MDHVLTDDVERGEEIARACGQFYNPKCDHNFARVRDGRLLGGVMFNHYTRESMQIHVAGFDPHWGTRLMIYLAFDYPFNQLGVKRLFGMVPETNWRAQVINMKLGFKMVARIEGVFRHGDACVVMRMDREDCRLLGLKPFPMH